MKASNFPKMDAMKVSELRANDSAVRAIQARDDIISFDWLRESFKKSNGLKASLEYGTAILSDCAQLDQYLYTYGKMIQSQWQNILAGMTISDKPVRLSDYGCGQGLAGLIIADQLGRSFLSKVTEIILVEPSEVALIRAEAVYRNLFPNAPITCLNVMFDDLEASDFPPTDVGTLHIFSNVLDIPKFQLSTVFNAALRNGNHTIIAVSHNRDFAGGAKRIRDIKDEIEKKKYESWLTVNTSNIAEFNCGDGGRFEAIGWLANLEVHRD